MKNSLTKNKKNNYKMENNKLAPFDPTTIMDGVRAKIKASFVELIPEEHWNAMVQSEIDKFFKSKEVNNGYGNNRQFVSDFQILINSELRSYTEKKIKEHLNSVEFQTTWDRNGQQRVSDGLKKIIVENSGEMFTQMIGEIFQMRLNMSR